MSVANASTLDLGASSFTVMMWVKRNALGGSSQRHLFSKCHATLWQSGCKELYFFGNRLRFGSQATGDAALTWLKRHPVPSEPAVPGTSPAWPYPGEGRRNAEVCYQTGCAQILSFGWRVR